MLVDSFCANCIEVVTGVRVVLDLRGALISRGFSDRGTARLASTY